MAAGIGQFAAIQAAGAVARDGATPVNVREAGEIEHAIAAFARAPNGGLIVTAERRRTSSRSDHHAGSPAQAARGLSTNVSSSPAVD